MVVYPLGARQLYVGGDVRVVAGRAVHHDWQTVFTCLQAAITVHWKPLDAGRQDKTLL